MIEVIYNETGQAEDLSSVYVKIPKNIRQIGEIHSNKKIYVEDYVITYLRQLSKKEIEVPQAAILLGESKRVDGIQYIFASGAIETDKIEIDSEGIQFTDDTWTHIYETIKGFFDELEIVGWLMMVPGYHLAINGEIVKAHIRNFSGNDKVFMMIDPAEREESFYLSESGDLVRQSGYYIYFEKNAPMQNYMIYKNQNKSIEVTEKADDHAAVSFRNIVQERKEQTSSKGHLGFMYAVSTFLVMVVLVIGITMINNYEKMQSLEASLQDFTNSGGGSGDGEALEANNETNGSVPVEQVPSDMEKDEDSEKNEASSDAKEVSSRPKTYTVVKGDTLASISTKIYGDKSMITKICELNNIENGDRILTGQTLTLP